MSVYDLFFAFRKPGTYFLDHTKDTCEQRLPKSYYEWTETRPIQTVNSFAANANDTLFMCWEDRDGRGQGGYNRGLKRDYPALYEFVEEHGKRKCRVAFGPDPGDFVVFLPETGKAKWKHTGISESRVLKGKRRVKHCSLGQNDAYVVLWADGAVTWAVDHNYPELEKILQNTKQGDVVFVCLNPYRSNEFFIALADGVVHIRASALAERHVLDILSDYSSIQVITSNVTKSSQSLSSKLGLSSSTRTKEFTKFIAKEVAGGIISTAIAATFSCTVM
ncbi:unnamed protein product [Penicillium pancosmium]